jgi:hypothetical protein
LQAVAAAEGARKLVLLHVIGRADAERGPIAIAPPFVDAPDLRSFALPEPPRWRKPVDRSRI